MFNLKAYGSGAFCTSSYILKTAFSRFIRVVTLTLPHLPNIDWFCFDCLIDIRKRSMKQEMENIVNSYPMRRVGRNRLKVERLEVIAAILFIYGGFGLGPSRAGALRKSGTGCCISVVKRIVGCSTIRGLMSSCISVFAVFRRGNVADLSVIDAVDVFTPPTPPSLALVFWDAR
uniref:Uncharacterized protein n=1 Tax=Glossina pallidipes TaxID=7398 RepID=A0A1A9ZRP7_GLOPL